MARITHLNDEFLAKIALGPVERFKAKSADGTMIDTYLTRPPLDPAQGKPNAPSGKLPTVLRIHGGPVSQYSTAFNLEWQMLAAQGFVDTVESFDTWGSYASGDLAKASNQFAAMPSLHIGWSLWCGIVIVALAERSWVRVLGGIYPVATLFVIIGTGNHYLLDAVGGVLALALGFGVQRLLSGRPALAPPALVTPHAPELVTAH